MAGRDEQNRFWRAIATGLSSEDAALEAGVSQPVGTRLFRKAGGMPPAMFRSSAKPLSGRYLSLGEREEIALLTVQGHSMQEIGRRLRRAASTISRELRRNAATRSGGLEYRGTTAQWHADRSARRPKPTKLALNATLRTYVEERLAGIVVAASGAPVPGPAVPWKGRRHGRRKDRRWAKAGALSRLPDACRSTSPVGSGGFEAAVEHVGSDGGDLALTHIRRQATPSRACFKGLQPHQSFDPMQSARHPFGEQIMPDTPGPVGSIAGEEAGANLRAQLLIAPAALTARPCQPRIETTPRDAERLA